MSMMRWSVLLAGLLVVGCAGVPSGEGVLREMPGVPAGFVALPSKPTSFRSAEVSAPEGVWKVNYEGEDILVTNGVGKKRVIAWSWYPQEGGADAALCLGYRKGAETLIRLQGTSEFLWEEAWFFFADGELREAVKYSLPGEGQGPEWPGTPVPADKRVRRETF